MALSKVKKGKVVSVVSLDVDTRVLGKLSSLGLVPGAKISVVHNGLYGACVVGCRGSRFVLGRGLANIIHVTE